MTLGARLEGVAREGWPAFPSPDALALPGNHLTPTIELSPAQSRRAFRSLSPITPRPPRRAIAVKGLDLGVQQLDGADPASRVCSISLT